MNSADMGASIILTRDKNTSCHELQCKRNVVDRQSLNMNCHERYGHEWFGQLLERVVVLCVSVGANGLSCHFNLGLLSDTLGPL